MPAMPVFILELLRAISLPEGPGGELLSMRRKYHLLQADWYNRLAKAGEEERKQEKLKDEPAADPCRIR
jgi:hypothetical protein